MTTLEKTSAEIRRLLPRLMECTMRDFVAVLRQCPSLEDWINECPNFDMFLQEMCVEAFGIGVITLEDVLEAFYIAWVTVKDGKRVYTYKGHPDLWRTKIELDRIWEYGKPYSEQSPEVHNFVDNILFSK